ncbi:MAG TPA: nitroreductase [Lachnospiraceae bacterium]|nr:nitroreductase [Lachnospiraceae bacterium]
MEVKEAIEKRRSIRHFSPKPIEKNQLYELVRIARLAPQAANVQPLKFMIVHQKELLEPVFSCLKWAGYLPGYAPKTGYHPTAYIVILVDTDLKKQADTDAGLAAENLMLAAVGEGLGTCMLGAVDRVRLRKILGVPDNMDIHSVIALGYPAEDPVWEEKDSDSIKYYLDESGRLHVPKRRMNEILVTIHPDLSDEKESL